jgi:hypothetical protein
MVFSVASRCLAIALCSFGCFALLGCGDSEPTPRSANASERSVGDKGPKPNAPNSYDHDFGVVSPGANVSHRFVVKNSTASPWKLEGITRSCSCSVIVPSKQFIAAGESEEFPFELHVSSKPADVHQKATVHFKGEKDEDIVVELRVAARVREALTIQPAELAFGQVAANSKDYRVLHIENYSAESWENVSFPDLPPQLTLTNLQKTREEKDSLPRQTWKAEFQLDTAKLDIKSFQSALKVNAASKGPSTSIPIRFTVIDGIQVTPSVLNFGKLKPGESSERKLIVRINGKHQGTFSPKDVAVRCESGRSLEYQWAATEKDQWILSVRMVSQSVREEFVKDRLTLRFPRDIAERHVSISAWLMDK